MKGASSVASATFAERKVTLWEHQKACLIEFGRASAARREREGRGRCETFDFLGFTYGSVRRRPETAVPFVLC